MHSLLVTKIDNWSELTFPSTQNWRKIPDLQKTLPYHWHHFDLHKTSSTIDLTQTTAGRVLFCSWGDIEMNPFTNLRESSRKFSVNSKCFRWKLKTIHTPASMCSLYLAKGCLSWRKSAASKSMNPVPPVTSHVISALRHRYYVQ